MIIIDYVIIGIIIVIAIILNLFSFIDGSKIIDQLEKEDNDLYKSFSKGDINLGYFSMGFLKFVISYEAYSNNNLSKETEDMIRKQKSLNIVSIICIPLFLFFYNRIS